MAYVTQAEMDALAALANENLLPIVNNLLAITPIPGWGFGNSVYDKRTIPNETSAGIVFPQPAYSFTPNAYENLIPAGSKYNGSGSFSVSVTDASDYDLELGENDIQMAALTFDYTYNTFAFYLTPTTAVFTGTQNQPVTAVLTKSTRNWLSELNRIYGDLSALFTGSWAGQDEGGLSCLANGDFCVSGPWIVGLNDPATFPMSSALYTLQGTLPLAHENTGDAFPDGWNLFGDVKFTCSTEDAFDLGVTSTFQIGTAANPVGIVLGNDPPWPSSGTDGSFSFVIRSGFAATVVNLYLSLTLYSNVNPLTISCTTTNGTIIAQSPANGTTVADGPFSITLRLQLDIDVGDNAVTLNVSGVPHFDEFSNSSVYSDPIILTKISAPEQANCLSFNNDASSISIIDGQGGWLFLLATNTQGDPYTTFALIVGSGTMTLSDPNVKGVWSAMTYPAPGMNVFLDQDLPPFIGQISTASVRDFYGNTANIAISANYDGGPLASGMRCQAPGSANKKINPVVPGLTTRPTKWLSRRDTDFLPFNLGFNTNTASNTFTSNGPPVVTGLDIPPDVTNVNVRIVQPGTVPGWYSGKFLYGLPLPFNVTIYVKAGSQASPTNFDFSTNNNAVTIPGDGGAGYLARLLNSSINIYVENLSGTPGAFGVYIESVVGTQDRIYIPPSTGECFSYVIPGRPGQFAQYYPGSFSASASIKPIPLSGYCVFMLRATRMPIANAGGVNIAPSAGMALTITIGRNVLQDDGSILFTPLAGESGNLTISIPTNARDTGDVPVWIPVLDGTEIVYQCSEAVYFEAWANWQPIFFNNIFNEGQFPIDTSFIINYPNPSLLPYAMSFANTFDVSKTGWAYPQNPQGDILSVVTFPLHRALYDDLMACLALIDS